MSNGLAFPLLLIADDLALHSFASVHGAWMSGVREAERVLDCIGEEEEEDDDESNDDD